MKILMGHAVYDVAKKPNLIPSIGIDSMQFESAIKFLVNNNEPKDFDGNIFETNLICTFDDGYQSIAHTALPILEKYNVPCIIFITTGFIDKNIVPYEIELFNLVNSNSIIRTPKGNTFSVNDDLEKERVYQMLRLPLKSKSNKTRQKALDLISKLNEVDRNSLKKGNFLNWKSIRELDRHDLITIGCHTYSHPMLTKISFIEAYSEIKNSKKKLEKELGHSVNTFSYPYGDNNYLVKLLVKIAGFDYAFSTKSQEIYNFSLINKLAIPRIDISEICIC